MKCCALKKTIALVAVGVLALVVLAKTTNVGSYVGTFVSKAKESIKESVPTEFDLDRIDREIAGLDQKLDQMYKPIAQHKRAVERLRDEIAKGEARHKEQKEVLLAATQRVKAAKKGEMLCYGGKPYSVDDVTKRIEIDFNAYKRQEKFLAAQRKLLDSREVTLQAAQDQMQAFIAKREEFRVQLAQLRAEHEINKVNAVGTDVQIDSTPLASIAQSLNELKDRIQIQSDELAMKNTLGKVAGIQLNQPQQSNAVDLDAIQAHLENGAAPAGKATSTASNK